MDRQPDNRPPFVRAEISLAGVDENVDAGEQRPPISCLPDLILHNALANPDHIFAVQTFQDSAGALIEPTAVSFLQLAHAVERCCNWILHNLPCVRSAYIDEHGCLNKSDPVAIFVESDLGLFIYLAALLTLQVPVRVSTLLIPA